MSIEAATEALRAKVGDNSGLGATLKFALGDDGVIFLDGKSSPNSVHNENIDANCTVKMKLSDLNDMLQGKLEPTTAFMLGKLKVEGDMNVALKLNKVV